MLQPYTQEIIFCYRGICTSIVTAALFTIAKNLKQPTFLLAEEWIKKISQPPTNTHTQNLLTKNLLLCISSV